MPKWYEHKWMNTDGESEWHLKFARSGETIARVWRMDRLHAAGHWETMVAGRTVKLACLGADVARTVAESQLACGPCELEPLP